MEKELSEYTTEELVELWAEVCRWENLCKFKNIENCWKGLAVREKIYDRNSYEREFYGRGVEYSEKVKQADENLLRWVLENGVENYKERDLPTNWWWHLDLVAKRFYPA